MWGNIHDGIAFTFRPARCVKRRIALFIFGAIPLYMTNKYLNFTLEDRKKSHNPGINDLFDCIGKKLMLV